jgi:hypothetical protein
MSSSRAIVKNFPLLVDADMSASITSNSINLDKIDQACFQVVWNSTDAVGVLSVQGSVDGSTFTDLTFNPSLTQPNSDSQVYLINLALIPFTYVRINYVRTSGSGTLNVNVSLKGA